MNIMPIVRSLPTWAIVAMVASAGCAILQWRLNQALEQLVDCSREAIELRTSKELAQATITSLKEHVLHQNAHIEAIEDLALERMNELNTIERRLQVERIEAAAAIEALDEEGSSCHEGIALIDQELAL